MQRSVLTSWKEVAEYLGKGVRTVQRWERRLGLPVHRPGNGHGVILVLPDELDEWIRTRDISLHNSDFTNSDSAPSSGFGRYKTTLEMNLALRQQLIRNLRRTRELLLVHNRPAELPAKAEVSS